MCYEPITVLSLASDTLNPESHPPQADVAAVSINDRGRRATLLRRWIVAFVVGTLSSVSAAVSAQPACTAATGTAPSDCLVINGTIVFTMNENIPAGGQELPLILNGNFGMWSVVLIEPVPVPTPGDPNASGNISDVLISNGQQLMFGSDDANHPNVPGGLTPPPNAIPMVETGGFIDLSYLLPADASFINADVVVPVRKLEVQSDVASVPLPAALPLLGSGLLGLLRIGWRWRKTVT